MYEHDRRQVCLGACGNVQGVKAVTADIGELTDVRRLRLDGAGTNLRGNGECRQHGDDDEEDDEQGKTDTGEEQERSFRQGRYRNKIVRRCHSSR